MVVYGNRMPSIFFLNTVEDVKLNFRQRSFSSLFLSVIAQRKQTLPKIKFYISGQVSPLLVCQKISEKDSERMDIW